MNARLKMRLLKPVPKPDPQAWTMLPAPVDSMENTLRMRAQSILSGPLIGQCPPLSIERARDVIRWASEPVL